MEEGHLEIRDILGLLLHPGPLWHILLGKPTCVPAEVLDTNTHPGINRFALRFAPGVDVVVLGIRAH